MRFTRKYTDKKGRWSNVYVGTKCKNCKFREECFTPKNKHSNKEIWINPYMRKIRLRLKTKSGKKKYDQRFHIGEVAQAHIEHNLGYREFKCRSINSCENELNLMSTAYNLVKIKRYLEKKEKNNLFFNQF